ncbi:MAG: hypothetical protein R2754_17655 [Microthrixaceae bacterium]
MDLGTQTRCTAVLPRPLRRSAAAAACAILIGAGCSPGVEAARAEPTEAPADTPAETAAPQALPRDQFVQRFSEICSATTAQLDGLAQPQTYDELAELSGSAQAIINDGVAQLRQLTPPEELKATVDSALGLLEQNGQGLQGVIDAARAQDDARLNQLSGENESRQAEAFRQLSEGAGISCSGGGG